MDSYHPPFAATKYATAAPTAIQVREPSTVRVYRAIPAKEVGAQGSRGGILLCQFGIRSWS
jgi:hypothetical protein